MEKIENRSFKNEDDSHSLLEEQDMEKEIELGLLHFRDEIIDYWEKETKVEQNKKPNRNSLTEKPRQDRCQRILTSVT